MRTGNQSTSVDARLLLEPSTNILSTMAQAFDAQDRPG